MNGDPKTRDDQRCACGCEKPLPTIALKHGDPFATSVCCRAHYGVVFDCDTRRGWGRGKQHVLQPCPTCRGKRARRADGRIRCAPCERRVAAKRRKELAA